MSKLNVEHLRIVQATPRVFGSRLAKIVALHDHNAVIDYPGNPLGPQPARVVSAMAGKLCEAYHRQAPVLLVFEEDDPAKPVILDAVLGHRTEKASHTLHANSLTTEVDVSPVPSSSHSSSSARLAVITAVEHDRVIVRLLGSETSQLKVRTAITLRNLKDPVVVLLLEEHPSVIIAQLHDQVPIEPSGGSDADVVLKGARVLIEADIELVLKSGACRIQLDAHGKAVTVANQIVSRARETNKVQGGSVQLN